MRLTIKPMGTMPTVPLAGAGDVEIPFAVNVTVEEPGDHTVELLVMVEPARRDERPASAWRPAVQYVTLRRNFDLPPITAKDLRRIPLERIMRAIVEQVATGEAGDVTAAAARLRRRHEITPALLRQVAAIYGEGGWRAVQEQLSVSRSQAFRLAAMARDAGYITDTNQEDQS
jgi:hypothetical protein